MNKLLLSSLVVFTLFAAASLIQYSHAEPKHTGKSWADCAACTQHYQNYVNLLNQNPDYVSPETRAEAEQNQESSLADAYVDAVRGILQFFQESVEGWVNGAGLPLVFSLDNQPCAIKQHPDTHPTSQWEFKLLNGLDVWMDLIPCNNTYIMYVDLNQNNVMDSGIEMLFAPNEKNIYHLLSNPLSDSNQNGVLEETDHVWEYIKFHKHYGPSSTPEQLNIRYIAIDGYYDIPDDRTPYQGQYVDAIYTDEKTGKEYRDKRYQVYLEYDTNSNNNNGIKPSEGKLRAIAGHDHGIILNDGTTLKTFDMYIGPLDHCSYIEYNYQYAEGLTTILRDHGRADVEEMARDIYDTTTEKCPHMAHGIFGIAAIEMINGEKQKAAEEFEKGFEVISCDLENIPETCDHYWSLADYAILTDSCSILHDAGTVAERQLGHKWQYLENLKGKMMCN